MDGTQPYDVTQYALCRYASVVLLLLLSTLLVRQRKEVINQLSTRHGQWLLGAVLTAFTLRMYWPDLAVFHENGHGYRYIGMAINPDSDLHVYGSGYQAFFSIFYAFLPPVTEVVLVANVLLGSLTVLFAGLFCSRQFGKTEGVFSAWSLALLPVHIKLSATESPFILAIFLSIVALWAIGELRTKQSYGMALIAGLAAGLAPQSRPLMLAIPIFVFMFGCFSRSDTLSWLRERSTWLFFLTTVAVLTLHVAWMIDLHGEGGRLAGYGQFLELGPDRVWKTMSERGLLLNPAYTPAHFLALAAIGCALLWKQAWRVTTLLTLGFLGLAWLYGARANHYSEALRFAAAPQVSLTFLIGPALARSVVWLAGASPARWYHASAALLLLVTALFSNGAIATPTVDALESTFLRSAYPELPQECAIIIPPARAGKGRIENAFPFYEYRAYRPGNDNFNWGLSRVDQPMLEGLKANNPCVLYYRGLVCSTFIPEEPMTGTMRRECHSFEQSHPMRKIASFPVHGSRLPTHLHDHPDTTFELAIFELDRAP